MSLLPFIWKVIEKVIHDQTNVFLNSEKLLYNYQSGFHKNHSTDFCPGMILIDLQKGFDTIDYDILLSVSLNIR